MNIHLILLYAATIHVIMFIWNVVLSQTLLRLLTLNLEKEGSDKPMIEREMKRITRRLYYSLIVYMLFFVIAAFSYAAKSLS